MVAGLKSPPNIAFGGFFDPCRKENLNEKMVSVYRDYAYAGFDVGLR